MNASPRVDTVRFWAGFSLMFQSQYGRPLGLFFDGELKWAVSVEMFEGWSAVCEGFGPAPDDIGTLFLCFSFAADRTGRIVFFPY